MKSTVVLIVSHDLSFPDERCVILVQNSSRLPCAYKPFAEFATVSSLGRGQAAVAMGSTSVFGCGSDFPCCQRSQGKDFLYMRVANCCLGWMEPRHGCFGLLSVLKVRREKSVFPAFLESESGDTRPEMTGRAKQPSKWSMLLAALSALLFAVILRPGWWMHVSAGFGTKERCPSHASPILQAFVPCPT